MRFPFVYNPRLIVDDLSLIHIYFDGAGSLCHGWSAIAAYYLKNLAEGEE